MNGSHQIALLLSNGNIDLEPLYTTSREEVRSLMISLRIAEHLARYPLAAFCAALDRAGRRATWLWKQIIFNLGCMIDAHILAQVSEAGDDLADGNEVSVEDMLGIKCLKSFFSCD